jgi:hypothetical protein
MRRRIDTITGKGTVTSNGGKQAVYQNDIPADHMQNPDATIPGLKRYEGRVLPVCFFGNQDLTLEMQDGRELKFFFTDMRGSIATKGALE